MTRWRAAAIWGIPFAFIVGMLACALLTSVAERQPERVNLVDPSPRATGTPPGALRGVRGLPDGRVVATLPDGQVIIMRAAPGRVVVNGTPQQYGPTWGAGQ